MAALIRAAFWVALPLLLLQLQAVRCASEDDESKDAEPQRTEPLSWDELQYTRLSEVNTVARKINEIIEKGNSEANPFDSIAAKIKPLRSTASVERTLESALSTTGNGGSKAETEKVKTLLCSCAQRLKRQLKSVISLAELIADTERPDFLEITKTNYVEDDKFKQAMQNLTPSSEDKKQVNSDIISREVNESEYGTNLYGRKNLAIKKLHVLGGQFKNTMKSIGEGANYALNSIFDAIIATKNVQRELKSTQEYPENVAQEEEKIKKALAVVKTLGCSKKAKKGDAKRDDDDDK